MKHKNKEHNIKAAAKAADAKSKQQQNRQLKIETMILNEQTDKNDLKLTSNSNNASSCNLNHNKTPISLEILEKTPKKVRTTAGKPSVSATKNSVRTYSSLSMRF
jgi:hypothetical protein